MPQENDKRQIKLLYVGLATWFLIFLNALRLASRVPYQAFVLGGVINIAVIVTFILALRNAYRRLERDSKNKSSQQAHTSPTHDESAFEPGYTPNRLGMVTEHGQKMSSHLYRAGVFGYFITCYIPFLVLSYFVLCFWVNRELLVWPLLGLLFSLTTLVLFVVFLRSLRLEITDQGISYLAPFKGKTFIGFNDIVSATLVDYRLGFWRSFLRFTLVLTPSADCKTGTFAIPLTLFPSSARSELVRLLDPAVHRRLDWKFGPLKPSA